MSDQVHDTPTAGFISADPRTLTALGERVAIVETKVSGLQAVVEKISANIHGMNNELMKIQVVGGRNSDTLDGLKTNVAERGVQIAEFRANVTAQLVELRSETATQVSKLATAVEALSTKSYLLEGAWGATVRISAAIVASIGILGMLAKLLGFVR